MASIKSGVYKRFYLERGHFSTTSERKERSIYSKYYGTHFNKILFLGLLTFALVPIPKLPFYLKHYRKFFLNVNSKNVAEFQQESKTMFVHEDSGPIQIYGTKLCLGATATYNGARIVASTDCSWRFTFRLVPSLSCINDLHFFLVCKLYNVYTYFIGHCLSSMMKEKDCNTFTCSLVQIIQSTDLSCILLLVE